MNWPKTTDYGEAIQKLRFSVSDEELQAGQPALNSIGLPMLWSGNYADVYRIHCPATGNTWAFKCFTREAPGLQARYREIAAHLEQARLPFIVDFQYLEQSPLLEDIIRNGRVVPLSPVDEAAVDQILRARDSSTTPPVRLTEPQRDAPWWLSGPASLDKGQTAPVPDGDGDRQASPDGTDNREAYMRCPSCSGQVLSPETAAFDKVVIEPSGDLVSPRVSIIKRSGFWTEVDIKVRGLPWSESQPEPCMSKGGALLTVGLVGTVPMIFILLFQLLPVSSRTNTQ